ncbi:hypothetical protein GCM10010466_48470 [Planomonospora alba]|uniref:Uncharacterized protein n=1 Tax=Planomonospora alba TaxID=161354 RepID=A0ABP6NL35_9ACTN
MGTRLLRQRGRIAVAGGALACSAMTAAYGLGAVDQRLFTCSMVAFAVLAFARTESGLRRYGRDMARMKRMSTRIDRIEGRLRAAEKQAGKRHAEQARAMAESRARMKRDLALLDGRCRSLERAVRDTYAQTEAFVDLRAFIRPRAPLPPLVGWAAPADALRPMIEWILRVKPKTIVECGSGSSSVWLGYIAEQTGSTVVALEHDPQYAEESRALVRAHGLSSVVDVRLAPLEQWESGGESWRWYSREALADLVEVGLLFVDGPPGATGPTARYPALPLLLPYCAEQVAVFLDDAGRTDETAVSDRWAEEFPQFTRSKYQGHRGLDAFVRNRA